MRRAIVFAGFLRLQLRTRKFRRQLQPLLLLLRLRSPADGSGLAPGQISGRQRLLDAREIRQTPGELEKAAALSRAQAGDGLGIFRDACKTQSPMDVAFANLEQVIGGPDKIAVQSKEGLHKIIMNGLL